MCAVWEIVLFQKNTRVPSKSRKTIQRILRDREFGDRV